MKNDDISFQHILPRLNATDLKFLYDVNTETRKLIKRSSRAGDLKEKFWIEEMSSISTLEVAWEHFPWGKKVKYVQGYMDEQYFCMRGAETNKLELLKWAREEKKCEWDYKTINVAASQGNLEMVKYCVANECPIDEDACAFAAFTRSSRGTQILTRRSQSALGSENCHLRRLLMVIFTYLSILLSVSLINITQMRARMRPRTATSTV